MRKALALLLSIVIGSLAFTSSGFAAGFRLPDQDSTAMGMAGAFVGQADNPSALWYNPSGITQLDGTTVAAGVMTITPVMKHENNDGSTDVSKRTTHLPVTLFAVHKMNDQVAFGLGITNPFGLSTNWSDTSATSQVATFSKIVSIDINPNVAYKASDRLSFAIGIDYIKLEATMEKLLMGVYNFSLQGDGYGWGANAGALWKATDRLSVGLSYRSKVKIDVDGTAKVEAMGLSNSAQTNITLPDLMQVGVSYKASDNLTMNADLDYTGWSSYDKLTVTSDTIYYLTGTNTSTEEKQWKNTLTFRIGGQYKLSEQWKARAGFVYDQNPVPDDYFDTRVPDSDRQGITIGGGYANGAMTIDAAYMYLKFKNRTITNSLADDTTMTTTALNGTYTSEAHIVGVTVAYKF